MCIIFSFLFNLDLVYCFDNVVVMERLKKFKFVYDENYF